MIWTFIVFNFLGHNSSTALFSRRTCLDCIVPWDLCNGKGLTQCKYSYTDRKWEVMSNKSWDVTMWDSKVPKQIVLFVEVEKIKTG